MGDSCTMVGAATGECKCAVIRVCIGLGDEVKEVVEEYVPQEGPKDAACGTPAPMGYSCEEQPFTATPRDLSRR